MAEYIKIGKLVAVHGVKGELVLKHTLGRKTGLRDLTTIFIEEHKNTFLPWFLESAKIKNEDEVLLSIESLHTREAAQKLVQKEVWLAEPDFKKFVSKSSPASLLGYTIVNLGQPLAPILEVIEQPHQLLCRLEINAREVLVPLNEEFLEKIDHRSRQVFVRLPDGLLDIYL